jgi:hypothetical protein
LHYSVFCFFIYFSSTLLFLCSFLSIFVCIFSHICFNLLFLHSFPLSSILLSLWISSFLLPSFLPFSVFYIFLSHFSFHLC